MERVRVARTGVSESEGRPGVERRRCRVSVSYTHLTLPTKA